MREDIRDRSGKKIGYVEHWSTGKTTVHDARGNKVGEIQTLMNRVLAYDDYGRKLGYWDKSFGATYDARGNKISQENTLYELFFKG